MNQIKLDLSAELVIDLFAGGGGGGETHQAEPGFDDDIPFITRNGIK